MVNGSTKKKMAGESNQTETLSVSNTQTACNVNLTKLRDRVKDFIDKVKHDSPVFILNS